jgi:hypothetical protein
MLRPESVASLRAYTALPSAVQGMLERHGKYYQLGGAITNDPTFDRILAQTEGETLCLARLRILRSQAEEPRVVEGSFVVRGKSLRLGNDIFALVTVVVGSLPDDAKSASGAYLLRLTDADFVRCGSPQQLPYGTNPTTGDLVPNWNYVAPLFDRRLSKVVVACPNGLFILLKTRTAPSLTAEQAEATLKNLRDVEFMAQVSLRPKRLLRLATNCLLAAPDDFDVAKVQQNLRLPLYPEEGDLAAVGPYLPSRSLLRVDGPSADYDALRAALPSDATLSRQPLSRWWSSAEIYDIAVELRLLPGQEVPRTTELRLRLGRGGDTEVRLVARHVPFRELRPGETEAMLRGVLLDNLREAVKEALDSVESSAVTQSAVNRVSTLLGTALQKQLPLAEVFAPSRGEGPPPVDVGVQVTQQATEGEAAKLPSGETIVIPAYSIESDSPRLASYLAAFSALGIQGSFQNWRAAKAGGVTL